MLLSCLYFVNPFLEIRFHRNKTGSTAIKIEEQLYPPDDQCLILSTPVDGRDLNRDYRIFAEVRI